MWNASDRLIGLILKEALLNVNHPDILLLTPLVLRSRRNLTKNGRPCSFYGFWDSLSAASSNSSKSDEVSDLPTSLAYKCLKDLLFIFYLQRKMRAI